MKEITTREVAEIMHVEVNTLRKYVERNQAVAALVRHRIIGHTRVWNLEDLNIYMAHIRGRRIPIIELDVLARSTSRGKADRWADADANAKIAAVHLAQHLNTTSPELFTPALKFFHQTTLANA